MQNIVWLLGILITLFGFSVLIKPNLMKSLLRFLIKGRLLYIPCVTKVLVGLIFIIFARDCRLWLVILTVGLLTLAGSIFAMVIPFNKLKTYCQWWLDRSIVLLRLWAVLAVLFGILIVYAGTPKIG